MHGGKDYTSHVRPSYSVTFVLTYCDLDLVPMLFTKDVVAQGCWFIQAISYTGLMRACKTSEEKTVLGHANVSRGRRELARPLH